MVQIGMCLGIEKYLHMYFLLHMVKSIFIFCSENYVNEREFLKL